MVIDHSKIATILAEMLVCRRQVASKDRIPYSPVSGALDSLVALTAWETIKRCVLAAIRRPATGEAHICGSVSGAFHQEAAAACVTLRFPDLIRLCAKRTSAHPISKLVLAPCLMRWTVGCVIETPSAVKLAAICASVMPELISCSTISWGRSSMAPTVIRTRIPVYTCP